MARLRAVICSGVISEKVPVVYDMIVVSASIVAVWATVAGVCWPGGDDFEAKGFSFPKTAWIPAFFAISFPLCFRKQKRKRKRKSSRCRQDVVKKNKLVARFY